MSEYSNEEIWHQKQIKVAVPRTFSFPSDLSPPCPFQFPSYKLQPQFASPSIEILACQTVL